MYRQKDPYSFWTVQPLCLSDGTKIGLISTEYTVAIYDDVQVTGASSVERPKNQQFILNATQRILIKNKSVSNNLTIVSSVDDEKYENYPVLIGTDMDITSQDGLALELLSYAPHTINTAVQQSTTAGTSSGTSSASSSTTGSSYSQSSTYGASISTGAMAGTSLSASYTTTRSTEQSKTRSQENSASQESSGGESMSMKNWGSYAWINTAYQYANWTFGQEYPWNAIQCRYAEKDSDDSSKGRVYISETMKSNLYDGTILFPPSELSYYGLNFVMNSSWRIFIEDGASPQIQINHPVKYYTASHYIESDAPVVYMVTNGIDLYVEQDGSRATLSTTLDLNIMGLDPVGLNDNAAIVGFIPSRFIPAPDADDDGSLAQGFRTLATTNDLLLEDTTDYDGSEARGYTASQTCLTLDLSSSQGFTYQLTLYFKITDAVNEYVLFLKHWKATTNGIKASFVFNGDTSNTVTKYVDALEAEGGDSNVTRIALRDLDFTSSDYHDYLQLGLNSVAITIEAIEDGDATYQIRAIAVQKA